MTAMTAREKRKKELDAMKEQRIDDVVRAALSEMCEKGIDNARISDIAVRAEIGVASVYRYFKTKPELVVAAASAYWSEEIGKLYDQVVQGASSFDKPVLRLRSMLEVFLELYDNHRGFLRFVEEFDNYVVKEGIPASRLADYEQQISRLRKPILDCLEDGKAEGSIRADLASHLYYSTTTHSLMSLTQKLALRGSILEGDAEFDGRTQLTMAIQMATAYLTIL